jgi:DNA-binding CsgD family transcriptional regulator
MADERKQRQQREAHVKGRAGGCAQNMRRTASSALAPALAAVIDSAVMGIALIGAQGNVLWVNRALEAMTAADGPLRIDAGARLHLASRGSDAKLQTMITASCTTGAAGILSIGSSRSEGNGRMTVQIAVIPLADREVAAAVYVVEPFLAMPDRELLRRLHGLTRMEARLAVELLQGASVAEAADRLGMSVGTARTHLKALFAKTLTSRQSDLVRLLGSGLARLNLCFGRGENDDT